MLVIKFLYLYIFFGLFVSFIFSLFSLSLNCYIVIFFYCYSMGNYGICNYCICSYGRLGCLAVAPSCGCLGLLYFCFASIRCKTTVY